MTLAILEADPWALAGLPEFLAEERDTSAIADAQTWLRGMVEGGSRRLVRAIPTVATAIADLRKTTPLGGPWHHDTEAAHAACDRGHRGIVLTVEAEVPVEAIDWTSSLAARLARTEGLKLHLGARVIVTAVAYGRAGQKRYPCRPGLVGRTMTI
jgi:hypothetical protein